MKPHRVASFILPLDCHTCGAPIVEWVRQFSERPEDDRTIVFTGECSTGEHFTPISTQAETIEPRKTIRDATMLAAYAMGTELATTGKIETKTTAAAVLLGGVSIAMDGIFKRAAERERAAECTCEGSGRRSRINACPAHRPKPPRLRVVK